MSAHKSKNQVMSAKHEWLFSELITLGATEGEARYVVNKISSAMRKTKDPNITHVRLSIDGNNEEEYASILSKGCCAFYDNVITLNSGKNVAFGFNYGH